MLSEEQLEIIEEALVPLFQYLEHEVIVDIARRIQKTMTYTRTAELQAHSMSELGYSPARIRKEAMKLLTSDPEYRKAVAKNTLEYKREIRDIINNITKEAYKANDEIVAGAGNMAWIDDLSVWKQNAKELTDNSFLPRLVEMFSEQTAGALKNMTQTTGFKTMNGYEAVENAYQRELDKAIIKVCSGTFSRDKVIQDTVHNLAQSGLRSIDFASGYSMQLDTATRMAVRTGCHQMAGKVLDNNIMESGENLVYVSKHWGARNTGIGHANHEQWQGRVYFVKEWKNYREEARRIGQDYITDLWRATGYSVDEAHENDPLGLYGYNCRHNHHPWFEGVSSYPKESPEPSPVIINGKEYDYYAVTQKMRAMERSIRALKREKEALKALGMDTQEINVKISRKRRQYKEFCQAAGVNEKPARLRYECGTSDLKRTQAWKQMQAAARDATRNTGRSVEFNPDNDYSITIDGYSEKVNAGLSEASRKVAELGGKDHNEHMYLVDLNTGELSNYETDGEPGEVGYDFWKTMDMNKKYAFVHNHNTDGMFSESDLRTMLNTEQIPVMIAVRNDGVKYIAERKGSPIETTFYDDLYPNEIAELNKSVREGIISTAERTSKREQMIVYNLLRDYTKGGILIEQDGRK